MHSKKILYNLKGAKLTGDDSANIEILTGYLDKFNALRKFVLDYMKSEKMGNYQKINKKIERNFGIYKKIAEIRLSNPESRKKPSLSQIAYLHRLM